MLPGDYVEAHRAKLMANPERYIVLLRKQNVLHCVWHVELQERIAKLEAALRHIKDKEGKVCDNFTECTHRACMSSYSSWGYADEALSEDLNV